MTTMEIEARKALLIREILADINSEEAIRKLQELVHRLKGESSYTMPSSLLKEYMTQAEKEHEAGLSITSEELDKEMQSW